MEVMDILEGYVFNLLYGRNLTKVANELNGLIKRSQPDFICVQECKDYIELLNSIPDYTFYITGDIKSSRESGILVYDHVKVDKVKSFTIGDGWRGHRPPSTTRLRLNGWCILQTGHVPSASTWKNGKLQAPPNKIDDIKDFLQATLKFMSAPCTWNARVAAYDWNERPTTKGELTPRNIAKRSQSRLAFAKPKDIDYVIYKGCNVSVRNVPNFEERSDHDPKSIRITREK